VPHDHPHAFPARRRLRRPEEFAAVLAARGPGALRLARRWLAVSVLASVPSAAAQPEPVRFGFTVGKRNARRAVERNLVKRVLRESVRHAHPQLADLARQRGLELAVSLRLKAPLAPKGESAPRAQLRRALRAESDELLVDLARRMDRLSPGASDA
jgi:ribonuclease P protein component